MNKQLGACHKVAITEFSIITIPLKSVLNGCRHLDFQTPNPLIRCGSRGRRVGTESPTVKLSWSSEREVERALCARFEGRLQSGRRNRAAERAIHQSPPRLAFMGSRTFRMRSKGRKWGHALCSSAKLLSVSAAPVDPLRQRRLIHQPRVGARHECLRWVRIIKRKHPKGFHLNGRMMAATLSGLLML